LKKEERALDKAKSKIKKDVLSVQRRINVRKAVKGGTVTTITEEPKVEDEKEDEKPKEEEDIFIITNPCRIL